MAATTHARGAAGTGRGASSRPGLVTFAAVVTFTVGALYALVALSEFSNSYWFYNNTQSHVYNLASSHLMWWGIFDVALAIITIAAGVSMLRGGLYGLFMGLTGASLSMLRWFFYIPAAPWLAITIIAIDALVLYALCTSPYFIAGPRGD